MIKKWIKKNEMFSRLLVIVMLAVIGVCLTTVLIVVQRSREVYITSYKNSNEIILDKIQDDYERLNQNINQIFDLVSSNPVIETYLTEANPNSQTFLDLKHALANTQTIFQNTPSNLVLIGENGRSFFQNSGVRNQSIEDLLDSDVIQALKKNSAISQYFFQTTGLTTATKNLPGLLYLRKLQNRNVTYGYALIFVTEKDFSKIYRDLLDDHLHTVEIVNHQDMIISASDKQRLGTTFSLKSLKTAGAINIQKIPLYSYNFTLYDSLDENFLAQNMNLIQPAILISVVSIILAALLAFILLRRLTSPVYHLIEKLPAVTRGDFSHKVVLEGTYEIQELGKAYNVMLRNLEHYVDDLLAAEQEKHLLEIRSLQMQIQPHFIYNTLTALKFLIWQNEQEKASLGIDSFIQLLQQTFNNREFLPLKEELSIAENYVQLLKIRYGEQIQTTFFAEEACEELLVPKMIIQPIIENAYLHAFPEQQSGYIQIFARISQNRLKIEIIDNGIGFDATNQQILDDTKHHYSSIGLQNINERIQLIYGDPYGLFIESEANQGTAITLWLPIKKD